MLIFLAVAGYWLHVSDQHSSSTVNADNMTALGKEGEPVSSSSRPVPGNRVPNIHSTSIWRRPAHVIADDGSAEIPQRYQFGGVTRVQTWRDFEDWMSRFSASDQVVLRGFDKQFFGVYRNRDPNQIAWMAGNGYPMPEDVLAAQSMSTVRLREAAAQGNIKAAFLLQSRELDQIAQRMGATSQTYGEVLQSDRQLADDLYNIRRQVMNSPSPYRGFLLARQESVQAEDQVGVDVLAALYLARMLGDDGAEERIAWYIKTSPNSYVREHRQTANAALAALYVRLALLNAKGGPTGGPTVELGIPGDLYPRAH
ncbi:MAG: hypothetical protein WBW92_04345 [Rhodanobacteraceae bacterium]